MSSGHQSPAVNRKTFQQERWLLRKRVPLISQMHSIAMGKSLIHVSKLFLLPTYEVTARPTISPIIMINPEP